MVDERNWQNHKMYTNLFIFILCTNLPFFYTELKYKYAIKTYKQLDNVPRAKAPKADNSMNISFIYIYVCVCMNVMYEYSTSAPSTPLGGRGQE